MHIKIDKNKLLEHLNNTTNALNNNTFLRSLQGMKICVSNSNIEIFTSNGSLSIKENIELDSNLEIIEQGLILIPGKIFINIIKSLNGIIELKVKENLLKISSDNFESSLNLLDLEDYVIDSFDTIGMEEFEIDVKDFNSLINDVSYACSDNELNKIILNGINICAYEGWLTASATNKFRLASKSIEIKNEIDFNITILKINLKHFIPLKAKGIIKLFIDENKVITTHKNTTVMTRLIEGIFPDIKSLIPKDFSKVLTVDCKSFTKVLEQSTVLSDDVNKNVKISIKKDNEMKIESRKKEIGITKINFSEFEYEGEPIDIIFNYVYVKQALSNTTGEIKIKFNEKNKIFSIETKDKPEYKQLILPLRGL